MKCPHCSFVSFEYLDSCRKCSKDLTAHKSQFGIDFLEPIALSTLAVGAGTYGGSLSDSMSDETASSYETDDFSFDDMESSGDLGGGEEAEEIEISFADDNDNDEIGSDFGPPPVPDAVEEEDSGFSIDLDENEDIDTADLVGDFADDEAQEKNGVTIDLNDAQDEGIDFANEFDGETKAEEVADLEIGADDEIAIDVDEPEPQSEEDISFDLPGSDETDEIEEDIVSSDDDSELELGTQEDISISAEDETATDVEINIDDSMENREDVEEIAEVAEDISVDDEEEFSINIDGEAISMDEEENADFDLNEIELSDALEQTEDISEPESFDYDGDNENQELEISFDEIEDGEDDLVDTSDTGSSLGLDTEPGLDADLSEPDSSDSLSEDLLSLSGDDLSDIDLSFDESKVGSDAADDGEGESDNIDFDLDFGADDDDDDDIEL